MNRRLSDRQRQVLDLARKVYPKPFSLAHLPRDGVTCFEYQQDAERTLRSLKRRGLLTDRALGQLWCATEAALALPKQWGSLEVGRD